MVVVTVEDGVIGRFSGGDLITIRNDAGDIVAARVIGPVAGDLPESERWRIEGHWSVGGSGVTMAEVAPSTQIGAGQVRGHDWGKLGLPDGLESPVHPAGEQSGPDEATLAHSSSGHRILGGNPLLTISPGDRVAVAGRPGTVMFIDRRKRTVEIDHDGDVTVHDFDDVQTQETT